MRLLRFLRHFALNCLNCLTFLTRTLNLIMSLLFPTFVLIPISACSFFQLSHALETFTFILQLVPFCLQREQVYYFPPFIEDEFLLMFIAFE